MAYKLTTKVKTSQMYHYVEKHFGSYLLQYFWYFLFTLMSCLSHVTYIQAGEAGHLQSYIIKTLLRR